MNIKITIVGLLFLVAVIGFLMNVYTEEDHFDKDILKEAPNVFMIAIDGLRWQEVFGGLDSSLLNDPNYTDEKAMLIKRFGGRSPRESRQKLMPFLWKTLVPAGQLYGNRTLGNKMNLKNKILLSYPGYNEILTGRADDEHIRSNDRVYNKNKTILERVNHLPDYQGRVAAFCSWNTFPYILNDKRSGVPVKTPFLWEYLAPDFFTARSAMDYVKEKHPKLLFIAYDEVDGTAHDGSYDNYIKTTHRIDGYIKDLWDYVQRSPYYIALTYFIITADHGRGVGKEKESNWTTHGQDTKYADQTWLAMIGGSIPPKGELSSKVQISSDQLASTVLDLLQVNLPEHNMGRSLTPLR